MVGVFFINVFFRFFYVKYFEGKTLLFSSLDGYSYALWTELFIEKKYTPILYYWNVPDFYVNLVPPVMMVYIAYVLNLLGFSLKNIYIYLPVVLSGLFVIPLFLWVKRFFQNEYLFLFLGGGLVGGLNLIYFLRTAPGRYDTDALILFFVFLIIYLISLAVKSIDFNKTLVLTVLIAVAVHFFMWWYYKPILMFFFLLSLLIGLVLNRFNFVQIFKVLLLYILLTDPAYYFITLLENIKHYMNAYFFRESSFFLPYSVSSSIRELQPLNWELFVLYTTDNAAVLIMGFIGLIFLFRKHFKIFSVALPFILIGLVSIVTGNRFVMYFGPFLGMGLGYMFYLIYKGVNTHLSTQLLNKAVYMMLIGLLVFISIPPIISKADIRPIYSDVYAQFFDKVKNQMESNSYIWSWWSEGSMYSYYFRRGTYISNGSFNPYKIYGFSKSLMTTNEEDTYKIISFITNNLVITYKDKAKNTDEFDKLWKEYEKFPEKPVYIFITQDVYRNDYIKKLGSDGKARLRFFFNCLKRQDFIYDCGVFTYNSKYGFVEWKIDKNIFNKLIILRNDFDFSLPVEEVLNPVADGVVQLVDYGDRATVIVVNNYMYSTVLNRMFVLKESFKNFTLVLDAFPYFVVYKVNR
ncbi:STT3 domain-containing protein [Persephonella sp.]